MFIHNKYKKWYDQIVINAKNRVIDPLQYHEVHHIIPRSLKGPNTKNNLVTLTAREHYICHLLLTKITSGGNKKKMDQAAFMLTVHGKGQGRYKMTSRWYEILRRRYSESKKGVSVGPFTEERCANISKAKKGKALTEEHKLALTGVKKGRPWSEARRKACQQVVTPFGIFHSMAEAERELGLGANSIGYRVKTRPSEYYIRNIEGPTTDTI